MDEPPPTHPSCTSMLKRSYIDNGEARLEAPRVKRPKVKAHNCNGQNITLGSSSTLECASSSTVNANFARGQLKLAVYWSQTHLLVHVFGARQLRLKNDIDCQLFIRLSIIASDGSETFVQRTNTIHNNGQLDFNETVTFHRDAFRSTNSRLLVTAYSQTSTRVEHLGCMSFGIVRLLNGNKEVNGWYHLLSKKRGRVKHLAVKGSKGGQVEASGTEVQTADEDMIRPNSILPWISLHYFDIERDSQGKYGFTILDTVPVRIGTVHKGGVAEALGLQPGDAFLEAGGHSVAGVRSVLIIDLLKKASGPLRVLLQRMNTSPQQPCPLSQKSLNRPPPSKLPQQPAKHSPRVKRKMQKSVSPRIEAFLSRTKPIVNRRLQRELVATVAMRTARQNQHTCLQSSDSCNSTYSRASTVTCESRRGSCTTKQDSLNRCSHDLSCGGSLDQRRLNRRSWTLSGFDQTSGSSSERVSVAGSDSLEMSAIPDCDETATDRSSTSSWESDLMASIAVDDLNTLERVLTNPHSGPTPDCDPPVNLDLSPVIPPTDSSLVGPSASSSTRQLSQAANKGKKRCKSSNKELQAGQTIKRAGRSKRSGVSAEIPLQNNKQRIIWSRRVTPIPLEPPQRQLVHTGRIFVQSKTKKMREMLLFLYTDVLLFAKSLNDVHVKVVCCPLVINEISILDFDCKVDRDFRITLVTGAPLHPLAGHGQTICLRAPTVKLKMTWRRFLQQRIMAIKCKGQQSTLGVGEHPRTESAVNPSTATTMTSCAMENNNDHAVMANHVMTKPATTADRPTSLQVRDTPTVTKDSLVSKDKDAAARAVRQAKAARRVGCPPLHTGEEQRGGRCRFDLRPEPRWVLPGRHPLPGLQPVPLLWG
ncbi:uncharacterized protein LOC110975754 [Acanthaster planci]|uniref:Uncharacterized protein LOC110975754 n=1 Tax=Acanthaster planci TaxID=133434 RepID=A0A8B7XTM0_ACAPL|nr:uncharacterized protein LOC110975754 [Acanthaster planci]